MKFSYLFIYVMLAIFFIVFMVKLIKKLKSDKCELNPWRIVLNVINLNGLRKTDFGMWFSALLLHIGIVFLVSTDTTLGINTLAPLVGVKVSSECLISLARLFCFIGGILSFSGMAGLIYKKFIQNRDFFYSKFSLLFILLVEICMWIPMIIHFDFLGFNDVVKGIVLFTPVEVPVAVMTSTLTGSAFLAHTILTNTTEKYLDTLFRK